ncbi:MAG: outer membrane lipid asymmetry maintenance protein MlaD [Candidatus Puniceispirillum sp.]|nr:outer membrane lipid asymmetry maintenance protein MlaD [Candidatus Pelagibacter sp.]MBA4283277.1 outer membrane lipid asymmetry maintenance protein MlaD [Candidatus Puniceispirillum sp.]
MSKNNTFETLLGLLVLTIAGLFIFYVYTSQHTVSGNQYTLHANFQKIDGINIGNDVKLSGVKVGTVSAIDVDVKNFQAKLSISIRNDLKIPTDSTLEISSEGLLGGKYVSIVPGGSAENIKPGQSVFQTISSMSLENLLSKFLTSSGNSTTESTPKKEKATSNDGKTSSTTEESKNEPLNVKADGETKGKKKLEAKKPLKNEKKSSKNNDKAQLVNDDLFGFEDPAKDNGVKQKNKKGTKKTLPSTNEEDYFPNSSNEDSFMDDTSQKPKQKKVSKSKRDKSFADNLGNNSSSTSNEDFEDQPIQSKNMPQDSSKLVEDILNESFGQFAAPQKKKKDTNNEDSQDEGVDNEDAATTDEE